MNSDTKFLAAAVVLAGFLGVGGVSLAAAQEDSTSSTTVQESPSTVPDATVPENTAPSQSAPDHTSKDPNCPNMGGGSSSSGSTQSSGCQGRSAAPSASNATFRKV